MANLVQCPSCQSRLSVGDDFKGRRVKCPRCQTVIEVSGEPAAATTASARTPPPMPRPLVEAPLPRPGIASQATPPPTEDEPDREPRRKKRRRRKRRERDSGGKPAWVWLVLGAGSLIVILTFVASIYIAEKLNLTVDLIAIAIGFGLMMPISAVVAFLAMVITSAILGGIDFGPIGWAIAKGTAMLVFVNLCYMMPLPFGFGICFALAVWTCGWMFFFSLEFMEARILAIISWGLMTVVKLCVIGILTTLIQHGKLDKKDLDPKAAEAEREEARLEEELNEELKALSYFRKFDITVLAYETEDENAGRVRAILFKRAPVQDSDLVKLQAFKKINSVDLSGTPITDKGLKHLAEIKSLVLIGLEDNHVTEGAVKQLQKALPDAVINWRPKVRSP